MARKETLTKQQTARVVAAIKRLKAQYPNQVELAEVCGVSQQSISRCLKGTVGMHVATQLADRGIIDWVEIMGEGSGYKLPDSARDAAIFLMVRDGAGSEKDLKATADLVEKAFAPPDDQSVLRWVDMLRAFKR